MKPSLLSLAVLLAALATPAIALQGPVSNDQVAQRIIDQSIAAYPGPCACPYNRARNGSSCGRRSAYSRAGGYDTLCYREDVSDEDIQAYRQRHELAPGSGAGKRKQ
ncbi:hypothetical protein [Pseudomonas cremoricolorata]|uniref:hypothetical protein n=1 Tax=Pseudomonas cremoricolorata TaxID=157783 RepID=UPI000427F476|nr:hypothetical protein [Pseudomonas cremoricolorata]